MPILYYSLQQAIILKSLCRRRIILSLPKGQFIKALIKYFFIFNNNLYPMILLKACVFERHNEKVWVNYFWVDQDVDKIKLENDFFVSYGN